MALHQIRACTHLHYHGPQHSLFTPPHLHQQGLHTREVLEVVVQFHLVLHLGQVQVIHHLLLQFHCNDKLTLIITF